MTRSALIPETVWLSSRTLDALDEFGLVSGREHAAWLFGRFFEDAVEIHMVDGWVSGDRDSGEISRDLQLERRYQGDGLQLVGHLHSHACWVDWSPEDDAAGQGLRVSLAGRSSA